MTPRNRSLFLERGHAYVHLVYGSAYMLNVSSEIAGIGAGVLIRALEPRDGISIMQRNRQIERLRDLARGPGRLTAALQVDRRLDGLDLCREGPLWLGHSDHEPGAIGQSVRIGIARDANRFLRFYLRGSPFVSGPRSLTAGRAIPGARLSGRDGSTAVLASPSFSGYARTIVDWRGVPRGAAHLEPVPDLRPVGFGFSPVRPHLPRTSNSTESLPFPSVAAQSELPARIWLAVVSSSTRPPEGEDRLHEIKYDGHRPVAILGGRWVHKDSNLGSGD